VLNCGYVTLQTIKKAISVADKHLNYDGIPKASRTTHEDIDHLVPETMYMILEGKMAVDDPAEDDGNDEEGGLKPLVF
jgi:hypothetical protein